MGLTRRKAGTPIAISTHLGKIYIAEEAIATLAGLATNECYGVVGMASRRLSDGITEILGRDSLSRGVDVLWQDDKLHIEVHIVVGYGTRISEVSRNVISQVHYQVAKYTELPIAWVTVNVRSVRL